MRYRKRFVALAVFGALALGAAGLGGAQVQNINPNGRPKDFERGEETGYALWHAPGKGWRPRTTTRKEEHTFRGSITVEGGTFVRAHGHDLEKEGRLADHWKMGPKRHTITFEFKTDRGIDGINFTVSPEARVIRFNLHQDGKHRPGHIWIGKGGAHPTSDPFELVAHPAKKKKKQP